MATETHTTIDGEALDWICWRHYGRQAVAVEAVLDANQGLAAKGVFYDAGEEISLPELALPDLQIVRLWE